MRIGWIVAVLTLVFTLACGKSDGRSTTPDNVIDRAVHDVESSVEESPDRVEQAADDVGEAVEETPDRIRQTGDEVEETVDDTTGRE